MALVLEPDGAGRLRQLGWQEGSSALGSFPPEVFPLAYPTWGDGSGAFPALRATHHDGTTSTRLRFEGHETESTEGGVVHRVLLADTDEPFLVTLCLRTSEHNQVMEQWAEIVHTEAGPVTLHEVAAAAPSVRGSDAWLTHYGGGWAAEWGTTEQALAGGTVVLESTGAVRPHLQLSPFFLLSPQGPSTEEEGIVLAGAVAWGGAVRMSFSRAHAPYAHVRVWCGHAPTGASCVLDPGVSFVTPVVHFAWSSSGRHAMTQRMHRHVRDNVVRDGRRIRPIVLNNWEATYFDFDGDRLVEMMEAGSRIGAERFLLDDGWFGDEHPRDGDDAGLGDWVPDRRKLPGGLEPLCKAAAEHALEFGLWVEPEMVNPRSGLHADHPDWVVAESVRERREERNQLLLDLCREDVSVFVAATIGRLLSDHPAIRCLKWDANRDVSEPGSGALAPDRQSNLWVDTVRARSALMAEVAASWPEVDLMLCASGGGRTDLATLAHFHEVWLSDNTDAVARLRMQWAASQFLPPQIIAAHVTRWGNQDLAFAAAVAMSARFGFDLDPSSLGPEEEALCRRASAAYRRVRDLVQLGGLYRLVAPESGDGSRAAMAYVSSDKRRAVVFAYQLSFGSAPRPLVLAGLDPRLTYVVAPVSLNEDGPDDLREVAGDVLLAEGIGWPLAEERTAAIFELSPAS